MPSANERRRVAARQPFETFSGLPFRLVLAIFFSSFSDMDFSISFDAPFSWLFLVSPRFAESAAPAAFC
jgi:hypothetical protein